MALKNNGQILKKYPKFGHVCKSKQIIQYGNDSYGALSGRDLAAATISLYESVKEDYLFPRLAQTFYFGKRLADAGVPIFTPFGSHALYLDINKMFPERKWDSFSGVGFTIELLKKYGIRTCELGYMAWELDRYVEKHKKLPENMPPNFIRLAIPANVYHKEHIDYAVDSIVELLQKKETIPGVKIMRGKDDALRHFIVGFELLDPKDCQK